MAYKRKPHAKKVDQMDPETFINKAGMDILDAAGLVCKIAHEAIGQRRKYTDECYSMHPYAVARIVATVENHTPEMLAAAYLHDVTEDTAISLGTIRRIFGPKVASYVFWLTDTPALAGSNRAQRKQKDRERLFRAPREVKTIKLADLCHNTIDIVEHDPGFARVYLAEKAKVLDVLKAGDQRLWNLAKDLLDKGMAHLEGLKDEPNTQKDAV